MQQVLVFPNGFQVDISDKLINQEVNTLFDACWVLNEEIAKTKWLIYAKLNQNFKGEDIVTIFLEEAHISRNFKLR